MSVEDGSPLRVYPSRVRALGLALLLVASLASAQAPRREGTYAPKDGSRTAWSIDANHTLVWGGVRYTPVGLRVDGSVAAIDAANEAGIKDLLIDLPLAADWTPAIAEAEKNGQRYLVRIASLAPGAPAIAVDAAAYRIAGLIGPKHLDLPFPGATEALVVVALQRDRSIASRSLVPIKDGRLVYDTAVNANLANVVLVYPRTDASSTPDLWNRLDDHRDVLLARLQHTPFGKGLRGIVDPLGRGALPGQVVRAVPTSAAFQAEFASFLERKYQNIDSVMKTWSMGASELSTTVTGTDGRTTAKTGFADLARLVPLWSGGKGVYALWDARGDKVYSCSPNSQIWSDIEQTVALAASRRVERLCASIRGVVDVPVVQDWTGWSGVTEGREPSVDGMGANVEGDSPTERIDAASRAVSTAARWSTHGWLVATDVQVPAKDLQPTLDDLASLGLRAAFVRGEPQDVAAAAKDRAANPPPDAPVDAVFFPENAYNPAFAQRLPGGRWWLPTPEDGNRLDLGDLFYGYRLSTAQGDRYVVWAQTPGRYLFRVLHPENARITVLDTTDPDPKKAKNGLLLTVGQYPVLIDGLQEVPVPDLSLRETLETYARLQAYAENGHRVGTDETFAFNEAATVFDQNPGGSYAAMRRNLRLLAGKLSPLAWVEAESSRDTTFSDVVPVPGASNALALGLRVALPSEEGFYANYVVNVRDRQPVEMWIAARLTPERRKELEATIGGVTLFANEAPVSAYGAGFAWYHLGTTRFAGDATNVSLRMRAGVGAEAAIDAIVFAPPGWRPRGVTYPYDLIVPAPLPTGAGKSPP